MLPMWRPPPSKPVTTVTQPPARQCATGWRTLSRGHDVALLLAVQRAQTTNSTGRRGTSGSPSPRGLPGSGTSTPHRGGPTLREHSSRSTAAAFHRYTLGILDTEVTLHVDGARVARPINLMPFERPGAVRLMTHCGTAHCSGDGVVRQLRHQIILLFGGAL